MPSTTQKTAKSGCSNCVMRGLGLCRVLIDLGWEKPHANDGSEITQARAVFAARRPLFPEDEVFDSVPVICDGWAATIMNLSNGGRQILSFRLPGEMIDTSLLFEQQLRRSIEAITRGCYRNFDRAQLRAALFVSPSMFDRLLLTHYNERQRADQLITDLGRRTGHERVARLLLDLWTRLSKLYDLSDAGFDFPLRQIHIADATGLTPVYVSNILSDFRKNGMVEISDRALKINDLTKLRRLAT